MPAVKVRGLAVKEWCVDKLDVAIVGAGPVGLSLVNLLAGSGLKVAVVEQQAEAGLSAPAFDGREIALAHATRGWLEQAGIWQQLDPAAIWPLRQASVRDRHLPFALDVDNRRDPAGAPLGWLVANWRIRQAAWQAAAQHEHWQLHAGVGLVGLQRQDAGWQLQLADGRRLQAATVVAADSRFSATRRLLGVGARSRDHGTAMVVRNMCIDKDHQQVAWEWFGEGCTRALLPLQPGVVSAVVTLPTARAQALLASDDAAYGQQVSALFEHRWGAMTPCSSAHLYPMVTVYADRFAGPGFALAGDAAVGMHPVTAHGFNFGVRSAGVLARVLRASAQGTGRDAALARYGREHRLATAPLFNATGVVAGLFADSRWPARLARGGAMALATALPPFRQLLRHHLTA